MIALNIIVGLLQASCSTMFLESAPRLPSQKYTSISLEVGPL